MTAYLLIGEVVHGIADKIWKLPARSVKNDLFMRNIQQAQIPGKSAVGIPGT